MTANPTDAFAVATLFPDLIGAKMLVIGAGSVGGETVRLSRKLGLQAAVVNRGEQKLAALSAELSELRTHRANARDEAAIHAVLHAEEPDHIVLTTGRVQPFSSGSIDVKQAMDYFGDRLEPVLAIANWIATTTKKPRSFTIVGGFFSQPNMGNLAWSAMGPAIKGLVEHLAVELGPTRVNTVSPGPIVDTQMVADVVGSAEGVAAMSEMLKGQLPIGRSVLVSDVARQILLVAGDPIATGSVRNCEGGLSLVPSSVIRDAHRH